MAAELPQASRDAASTRVSELALCLIDARDNFRRLPAPDGAPATMDEAYLVQAEVSRRRVAQGQRVVGWKLGYTSAAMRTQMNIGEPNFAPLRDSMLIPNHATTGSGLVQPKVEPEIAIRFGRRLRSPVTVADVLDAAVGAFACLEIVDSVWQGYRFTIEQNTADGSSAAQFVLGPALEGALDEIPVRLRRNGVTVASGVGAAAMEHPASAVSWLVDRLASRAAYVEAGHVVLTGGLTQAVDLAAGDTIAATFGEKEHVSVTSGPQQEGHEP